jgi:hypothetical protein
MFRAPLAQLTREHSEKRIAPEAFTKTPSSRGSQKAIALSAPLCNFINRLIFMFTTPVIEMTH